MMKATNLCEEIYRNYRDKVFSYLISKVTSPQVAEDLLSHVFLKIAENIETYDETRASISTWVYTIAHNTMCNFYRDKSKSAKVAFIDELEYEPQKEEDFTDGLIYVESLEELADALANLKDKQRDMLILHYYKGLTLKKVADIMGITYANAKYIHREALDSLRKVLVLER